MQFSFDVFLSHNARDKSRVRKLAKRLVAAGVRVWFDEWEIKPGDDIYLAVERGLQESRVLVLCLSPAALASDWVALERSTVLFRDPSNSGRRFIPVLLADCDLPDSLRRYKYLDFRRQAEEALEELLTACRSDPQETRIGPHAVTQSTHVPSVPGPVLYFDGVSTRQQPAVDKPGGTPVGLRLRHLLAGHTRIITRMNWAPDGVRFASAGQDGAIRIWNTETGELIDQLVVPQDLLQKPNWFSDKTGDDFFFAIAWTPAWSPDGRFIACGYGDTIVRLWDTATGEILRTFEGHSSKVNHVAWSPDGKIFASSSDDRTIKIWNVEHTKCISTLSGHHGGINNIAWHPAGNLLASGSLDGTVRLWDTNAYKLLRTLSGHEEMVITVTWAPDGNTLASSSGDRTIRLWNPSTGLQQHVLEGHLSPVSCIAFSGDGRLLISKGIEPDSTVRIWRVGKWDVVASADEPSDLMWFAGIAFHPTQGLFASLAENDRAIRIWDINVEALLGGIPSVKSTQYCSAKVVLVGESGVGKSALAHRLIKDEFVQTDSTHGMTVWQIDLPLEPEENVEREVLLWDLAGQEDYRLIHRLFLDETALALVLFNPQKDDPFGEIGAWLKMLRSVAPKDQLGEMARILVAARADVGGAKVSQRKIDIFLREQGLRAYLPTSAKRGDNCSDKQNHGKASTLKQLIAKYIPWNSLARTSTPRLLADLKNAVIKMTEQRSLRLLRFAELAQRLEQMMPTERFGKADVRTAVALLANHGLVMPLEFGDLVLLRPELLNGYASAVIRAARDHTDEIGSVLEQAVFDRAIDLTGVDRMEAADEELLMRAIVQTLLNKSLCIASETPEGRYLIFPSQYRRDRSIPAHPAVLVSYTFTGEWQTVYTTLVVRLWYSREFKHRELWRNAAEFETSTGRTVGLLMEHIGGDGGTGTISVFFDQEVPQELKVTFIEYVHQHLGKYASEVVRDRRYVCPACGTAVTDFAVVRERLRANKDFIYCQKCDWKVELIDHIERQLASDPVARRVLGMDQKATRELNFQAQQRILTGHMMAICGEANQIFRALPNFGHGIDGEVEFKKDDGSASGKKIYVQCGGDTPYLRIRRPGKKRIFEVKNAFYLEYWMNQPVDVFLIISAGKKTIRWMNVTRYLRTRSNRGSPQIVFHGEKLDAGAIWRIRDQLTGRSIDH